MAIIITGNVSETGLEQGEPTNSTLEIVLVVLLVVFIGIYALFYKKLLPRSCWLPVSKFYFRPMIIPSYLWRRYVVGGDYFSDVDGKLILGAVPIVCAGHVKELHSRGVRATVVSGPILPNHPTLRAKPADLDGTSPSSHTVGTLQ